MRAAILGLSILLGSGLAFGHARGYEAPATPATTSTVIVWSGTTFSLGWVTGKYGTNCDELTPNSAAIAIRGVRRECCESASSCIDASGRLDESLLDAPAITVPTGTVPQLPHGHLYHPHHPEGLRGRPINPGLYN